MQPTVMPENSKKRRAEDYNENKKRKVENDLPEGEYEVEIILSHKVVDGNHYYRVKWKDYNEITWEPDRNLINCPEKLKEYKLAIKSRRKQDQNKESSDTKEVRVIDQRVVSAVKAINFKKLKYNLPNSFKTSKGDTSNNIDNQMKEDSRSNQSDGVSRYPNITAMPLELRLPPFGPGDQSIIFNNRISNNKSKVPSAKSPVNTKPEWHGVMYRLKNNEERRVGAIQITNYIDNSMENFPYLNQGQSKLVINQYMDLDDFTKDSLNSIKEYPIYVATVSTVSTSSEDFTELDNLQTFLSKRFKVGVINTEKLTLYLLPTSEEVSNILDVEKPENVNDLYFVLQLPRNKVSKVSNELGSIPKKYKYHDVRQSNSPSTSTLSSRTTRNSNRKISGNFDPAKKHKNSVTEARHYEKPQQDNILPSVQHANSNKEISNNLDVQSPFQKHRNSMVQQHDKMQQNNVSKVQPNFKEFSSNFEWQLPPAKKHKNSGYNVQNYDKLEQYDIPPRTQSVPNSNLNRKNSDKFGTQSKKRRSSIDGSIDDVQHHLCQIQQQNIVPSNIQLSSRPIPTMVESEPSKFTVNFTNELTDFFKSSNFAVIGSKYIESQRVITFLKEIGSNEVVAKDPRLNCVIFHQNDITQGFSFENFTVCKHNQTKIFLISKDNITLTLQEIFVSGGVILATSIAIKNTDSIIDNILYFTNSVNGWDFKIHPNILNYLKRLLTFLSDNECLRAKLNKAFNGIVNGLISGKIKYLLPNEMPLDDYDMDSRKLTFDSMGCLSKTNYDKYRHFVVIDDTDEIDEQSVENEMKGTETMSMEKLRQKFLN